MTRFSLGLLPMMLSLASGQFDLSAPNLLNDSDYDQDQVDMWMNGAPSVVPGPENVTIHQGESYDETANCTNDYCISDEEYYDMIVQHILPSKSEWLLIALHGVVFFVGLIGNALVCTAVYRNRTMRTVTNYFIVNLAVADFMVILFCLPPTVLWDVTQTWFMGTLVCKIVLYFQTVSVAVSVLTLTFISVDRWYAICFPLKFKSTTGRAKTAIMIIWLLSICFDIPELLALETHKFEKFRNMDMIFFTQCSPNWSEGNEEMFQLARILLLYTFPLLFMSIAYCQIVRVLWRSDNIPGHSETVLVHSGNGTGKRMAANNSTECQLRSRRKAAKMLVAVVLMFAVCYFPVHLLNMLRLTMDIKQTEVTGSLAIVSHWLCYANSAVNPVTELFMSGKFRKEFQRAFGNMCKRKLNEPASRCRGDSTMVCRYTTMTVGSLTTPKTEIVQLSNTNTVNDNMQQSATTQNHAPKRNHEEELSEARCSFDVKPAPVRFMSEKKHCPPPPLQGDSA
ncbi:hypothetical protein LSTR_LSTR006682 [Laodelphax striatellus]|uniref:G-protein coupled receptors family 1 profile domain-containing protein n=1 Tax=Laodelphax striatellus TaxID=195883 RepID=A0A482X8V0_LAOST|nr:hypothetical protein LSTR_LSTR006682 [Laodelphax striatellus]